MVRESNRFGDAALLVCRPIDDRAAQRRVGALNDARRFDIGRLTSLDGDVLPRSVPRVEKTGGPAAGTPR